MPRPWPPRAGPRGAGSLTPRGSAQPPPRAGLGAECWQVGWTPREMGVGGRGAGKGESQIGALARLGSRLAGQWWLSTYLPRLPPLPLAGDPSVPRGSQDTPHPQSPLPPTPTPAEKGPRGLASGSQGSPRNAGSLGTDLAVPGKARPWEFHPRTPSPGQAAGCWRPQLLNRGLCGYRNCPRPPSSSPARLHPRVSVGLPCCGGSLVARMPLPSQT